MSGSGKLYASLWPDEHAMSSNGRIKKPGEDSGVENPDVEVGTLVTQPHGGALRHGSRPGTNKGGAGRPKDELKAKLRSALDQPQTLSYLRLCLRGKEGPSAYFRALEFCADRVHGKLPTITQVSGEQEPLTVILRRG